MSTSTAPASFGRPFDVSGTARVPFTRLVKVELRKMADTRAGYWLLLFTGLIIVVAIVAVAWTSRSTGASFGAYMFSTAMPLQFLLPILGILLITGEWTQRTTLSTFTLEASRMRVMASKIVAALIFALIAMVFATVVAAIVTLAFGDDDPWRDLQSAMIFHLVLLLVLGTMQGVAFGAVLLSSAGAIVAFFAVPIVFSLVMSFMPDAISTNLDWIDISIAQMPFMTNEAASGGDWARLGTASSLWILLPLVIGLLRIKRMELK